MLPPMNVTALAFLALFAGAALAAQAAANARLGVLLHSAVAATGYAFFASLVVSLIALAALRRPLPAPALVSQVPGYLWVVGGLLSAFGVASFYWLIPQLGVAQVVAFGLVGQLVFSSLASHFGWFGLQEIPIGLSKLIGGACLITGIVLMQRSGT